MSVEVRSGAAFLVALTLTLVALPVVKVLARRLDLHDHPGTWKTHAAPTPNVGGIAVAFGSFFALLLLGGSARDTIVLLVTGALLCCVGVVDDRVNLPPLPRLAAEVGAATALWAADLGWNLGGHGVFNWVLTALWIVGVVNALNLLDLMDGAAGAVACAAGIGVGILAMTNNAPLAAVVAFAAAGGATAFLSSNLPSPARLFLGDGGSMVLGFMLATGVMLATRDEPPSWSVPLAGSLFLAVPLFDMAFRVGLRRSRGVSVMTAGPDSLANRLLERLGSTTRVAAVMMAAQLAAAVVAIAVVGEGLATALGFLIALGLGIAIAIRLQVARPRGQWWPSARTSARRSARAAARAPD
jgi:UDP-GlcNAc:undecaprenyl-phosphate GlcNAc-1-phosphate transferase